MRTCIIGLGRMGLRHLSIARTLGLEVVGVADPREEARQAAARDHDVPSGHLYASASDMVERLRPDFLVVASTAPSHADLVVQAAALGVAAILCEKPMAVSLEQCDRMIEACARSGTRLAVNHQMRFMEQYRRAKDILWSPDLGGLCSATVIAGNFGLAMNGCHYAEMFRFLTDEVPVSVAAFLSADPVPNPRGPEFSDHGGCLRLTTPSGRRFYLEAGTDQGHGLKAVYAGRYGILDVDELAGRMRLTVRQPEHRDLPTTRYGMPARIEECDIAPADAVQPTLAVTRALLAGEDYPDGAIGRMAVEILVAAIVSHEAGGASVDLREASLPRDRVFPWA